jgi:hypothetical protein
VGEAAMSEPHYVNQGTDPRLGGPLGHVLAFIQRSLSFHSTVQPAHVMVKFPPFISIAIPWFWRLLTKQPMRYATFRLGWRFDNNWPGYVFDVIFKLREEQVHY